MKTKENFYYSPINNLPFIDNLIFYSKLVLFTVAFALLITSSVLLGRIIPSIDKWLLINKLPFLDRFDSRIISTSIDKSHNNNL